MEKYISENKIKFPPYQIVKHTTDRTGRITVRRLRLKRLANPIFVRKHKTGLKYQIECAKITGNRILNIEMLETSVMEITKHVCLCPPAQKIAAQDGSPITLKSELGRSGLFTIIVCVCNGCAKEFRIANGSKHTSSFYDINIRAVWGTIVGGKGNSQLNEMLSSLDIPSINNQMFSNIENQIGKWWLEILNSEMRKAGEEERRLAIERGDFCDEVPSVTVICDGGWSKRTHKHSYNALGGVGVIFGAETKKLLHIGIRNKQCRVCNLSANSNIPTKTHECFKNWTESSQSMEADIILEGFLKAEETHGLRYTRIIADGDSSVFSKLIQNVPIWGNKIKKLECANHTCKCIRSNLEKLVTEKPHLKGKGKLSGRNIVRLTTAVRCAIKMRSKDNNSKLLKHDIKNSIYHILGFHERCSDFCKNEKQKPKDDTSQTSINELDTPIQCILKDQSEFWKLPSQSEMEDSRQAEKNEIPKEILAEIVKDVAIILNRVADRAERLIGNFTTNLAESWMSLRTKFDGGKVTNRCSRGSWNTRCYGAALRKNLGPSWSPIAFKEATGINPGQFFFNCARKKVKQDITDKKHRQSEKYRATKRKRKLQTSCAPSKKARLDYGNPLDDTKDIDTSELSKRCDVFYNNTVVKTDKEIEHIEMSTRQQNNEEWHSERKIRLTSSNFGKVYLRRPTNTSTCLVKNLLYTKFKGNINTVRGLAQEEHTKTEYMNKKGNVSVQSIGLVVSKMHPFLAASPDGLITEEGGNTGLIEIKNLLQNNKYSIEEAIQKVKNFCLEKDKNQNKCLKKNHEYYFQIQGQLNILNKDWCDFVLRRTNPYDIHIERIFIDRSLWKSMLPKLEAFYFKFLLPELSHPRFNSTSGIRSPKAPWVGCV